MTEIYDALEEFQSIKRIFPHKSSEELQVALMESNLNIDQAIDYILSMDAIQKLHVQEKNINKKQTTKFETSSSLIKTKPQKKKNQFFYVGPKLKLDESKISQPLLQELRDQFGTQAANVKTWTEIHDDSVKLSELMKLSFNQSKSILHVCNGDLFKSILFILYNKTKCEEVIKDDYDNVIKVKRNFKPKKEFRRVQQHQFADLSFEDSSDEDDYSDEENDINKFSNLKNYKNYNGEYDEEELLLRYGDKLEEIWNLGDAFGDLSHEFYLRSLKYFDGDIDSVILISCIFITENKSYLTTKRVEKSTDVDSNTFSKQKVRSVISEKLSNSNGIKNPIKLNKRKSNRKVANKWEDSEYFKSPVSIDFHQERLNTAMSKLHVISEAWWKAEIHFREKIGTINPNMKKAAIVAPLHIITGKGIHSVRGISIIKIKTRNFLLENKFLFEENVGNFTVYGKKN